MAPRTISAHQVLPGGDFSTALKAGAVTADGAEIVSVVDCPAPDPAAPRSGSDRHFPGCTILPGLIDGHAHLAFDPAASAAEQLPGLAEHDLVDAMHERARQMLRAGATTVRDVGDRDGLGVRVRDAIVGGAEIGPRMCVSGPPLTPPGGHCWFLGGVVDGEGEIVAQVHRLADLGVDWIKVMVSGGLITWDGPGLTDVQFSPEQLTSAVAAATERRLPVAAHAHGAAAVRLATACGVDTIEHCAMLAEVSATGLEFDFDPKIADDLAERGIAVCHADPHDWDRFSRIGGPEAATKMIGRTRWLRDRGVQLIAGTDAGVVPHDELVPSLIRHGQDMGAAAALGLATTAAAAALGLADRTGALTPGLEADALIVRGDPLSDLTALLDVQAVMTRGRLIDLTSSASAEAVPQT